MTIVERIDESVEKLLEVRKELYDIYIELKKIEKER